MRIDGKTTTESWTVIHGVTLERIDNVLWADDETGEWCQADQPLHVDPITQMIATTVRTGRVLILPALLQIVIDPPPQPPKLAQLPPEVHNTRPINADDCMAAVRAMCKGSGA